MTRFLFVTDTHFGAGPMGYCQQPAYPEQLDALLALLQGWIARWGRIDFVLHGGDMLNECDPDLIQEAVSQFELSVPVYLCLGNHDLTDQAALERWLELAPGFFVDRSPHFEIASPDSVVHVVPNHWDEQDYHWQQVQRPRFRLEQLLRIESVVAQYPDRLHVLCTHSPVWGIDPAQTGFDEAYHDPGPTFRECVLALLDRCPQIRCLLTGHNHINSLVRYGQACITSTAAFVEAPFEFKVVEVDAHGVSVSTHNLFSRIRFGATYDFDKTFVQGRLRDRHVTLHQATTSDEVQAPALEPL
jgi:hypothetical protein